MNNTDTIIALSTPEGSGALSLIRLSGPEAIEKVSKVFVMASKKSILEKPSHTIHLGHLTHKGEVIDEVLVSLFKSPHSYTGEEVVEISCHGSPYVREQVLRLFLNMGVRMAAAGEFTQRAFLNGKMDLAQAEAVADLIASESAAAHKIALNQLRGGFSDALKEVREKLLHFASMIELELDFSEEDVAFADRYQFMDLLKSTQVYLINLISSFSVGNAIKKGVPVAIAGKPNAGKSSLLNALLNEEKAIVSEIAGTTRDSIEDVMNIGGILFRFIDTAGLRQTDDVIESIGVARAKAKISEAQVLLYVYDPLDNKPEEVLEALHDFQRSDLKIVLVQNKIDIVSTSIQESFTKVFAQQKKLAFDKHICLSTHQKETINTLKDYLAKDIKQQVSSNSLIVSNNRHWVALKEALEALKICEEGLNENRSGDLLAIDLRQALYHIGSITGDISNDEILGNIFSKFCIGK